MSRRRHSPTVTKAQQPTVRPAATFSADQVLAIARAGATPGVGGLATPLPRPAELFTVPFGPGMPFTPAPINAPRPDSGRAEPRQFEYQVSWNLPGAADRLIPWPILRAAADRISLFRRCIEIRKNEVATLDWDIVISSKAVERAQRADPGTAKQDIEQAMRKRVDPEIGRLVDFWENPDRRSGLDWAGWAKKLLEERFVLDACAIYPRRTLAGDMFGFEIIDGSTIKPLLDEYGFRPMPPNPAFQQLLWGFPRGEFIADTAVDEMTGDSVVLGGYRSDALVYHVATPRTWTPYGYGAVEQGLDDGDLYLRRHGWMKAEYSDGVMPSGWLLAGEGQADWTADQLRAYEQAFNDLYGGQTEQRQRFRLLPYGMTPDQRADLGEKYRPDYDLLLIKLVASHFDTTIAELGFTEPGGLGSSGWHEGQADVQDRKATRPTLSDLQALVTRISRQHLGMPRELEFKILGLESEDEDAQDEVADRRIKGGRMTLNEDRDRTGLPRYTFAEADMPMIVTQRGLEFVDGAFERAQAGAMLEPAPGIKDGQPPAQPGVPPAPGAQDPGTAPSPKPAGPSDVAKAELAAYRKWAARRSDKPARPFVFEHLTKTDAQQLGVVDEHAIFKAEAGGDGDPKVWAGWSRDLAVANHWATKLRQALTGAIGTTALATAWLQARDHRPAGDVDDTAAGVADARAWLDHRGASLALTTALRPLLEGIWTDGYFVGDRAAAALLAGQHVAKADTHTVASTVDWGSWTPGDTRAAQALLTQPNGALGLTVLLNNAGVYINSIASHRLDQLAQALADGLTKGLSPAEIGRTLRTVLDDPRWAKLVALTETTRASTAATLQRYRDSGVPAKEWLTAGDQRVCDRCAGNETEGAIPVWGMFGDGGDGPPAHPGCRCALAPAEMTRADAARDGFTADDLGVMGGEELLAGAAATYDGMVAGALEGEEALDSAPLSMLTREGLDLGMSTAELRAFGEYGGILYSEINRGLRGTFGAKLDPATRKIVQTMDKVLARSPLDHDVAVWRGAGFRSEFFGDRFDGDLAGFSWREDAFVSTSARREQAAMFAFGGERAVLMRILVPAGQQAIQLSGTSAEWELLLQRGLRFRVVRDNGFDPRGRRLLDVEIVT